MLTQYLNAGVLNVPYNQVVVDISVVDGITTKAWLLYTNKNTCQQNSKRFLLFLNLVNDENISDTDGVQI